MSDVILSESSLLVSPERGTTPGVWRCCLIAGDVHGSSGYYSSEVLRRDGPQAFPAGTHIYIDHPTSSEEEERPERGVLEMAGVLLDDARYEDSIDGKGLFARVQFFEDVREKIEQRAKHIGMSIRASGSVEESEGKRFVRSIGNGISVDVVTRAGAGGRLVNMSESKVETASSGSATASSSTSPSGSDRALMTEVEQLRESISERMDHLTDNVVKLARLLRERDQEMSRQVQDAEVMKRDISKIIETKLPASSRARLVENYQPGQDLDEKIRQETRYVDEIRRESSRTASKDSSNLGLTESSVIPPSKVGSDAADDFSDIEQVLSGKIF